ncbi:MAG: hypothetical protein K1X65_11015 [Caldilineales bacterium]|nr:hypothetical protein [Caldilineales bacterium]MCW5856738.1 hypothetical protein [Caldilineales bacterium]
MTLSVRTRNLPIAVALLWLWGSVALFAFGPYDYLVRTPLVLYGYLTAANLALFLGYRSRVNGQGAAYQGKWQPRQMLRLSLVLALFIMMFSVVSGQGRNLGFRAALEDPALAYALYGESQGTSFLPYILIFLEPFVFPFLILTAFYWQETKLLIRLTFFLILTVNIMGAVSIALRGAIVFQVITVGAAFLSAFLGGRWKLGVLSKLQITVLIIAGVLLLLAFFSLIYSQRSPGTATSFNPSIGQFPDPDHLITQITPESQKPLVFGAITYLTHGYYGLSLALDKPFVGVGFGVTNSTFLLRNFVRFTGLDVLYDFSYANRLWVENGYPVGNYWISIYPWIASDVTWFGSLIIVFLIGRLFAQSWLDAVQGTNPAAVIVFVVLAHMIYAFPMNNPLQDGSALTRFYFWLLFWWFTRMPQAQTASTI